MASIPTEPIPWSYFDTSIATTWVWRTEHFEARIIHEMKSFTWTIYDYSQNPEGDYLVDGVSESFQRAEAEVKEVVGKSYPPMLGYLTYVGDLATTFTIATRERVNFADFAHQRCIVRVLTRDAGAQTFTGTLTVSHYELHITTDDGATYAILPAHIESVRTEIGKTVSNNATHTGIGRLHNGHKSVGCTGTPGFRDGTVDHTGPMCPIHER